MKLDGLAQRLADRGRIGLHAPLADKLGIGTTEQLRARLMAEAEDDRGHLGVYFLACYVVDDTDFWGDGEIYWWSIPALVDDAGRVQKDAVHGLPTGAPPHKCGDHEWMTSLSLREPPLLAVIPPDASVHACSIRLGIYDDDGAAADLPTAMTAGLEAYLALGNEPLAAASQLVTPVRQAIWDSLKADEDDILIEQDLVLRRGEVSRFGVGMVGSLMNAMARAYYFVRDEARTQQFGPITLHKGQSEMVRFDLPLKAPGKIALFSRGADVSCPAFGDLSTDMPFINRVLEPRQEASLAAGFSAVGTGSAKLIAFYTPG
ncbi:MAG: hypothetical protein IT373_35025 [Polyangiaceae bacterium]|nr:hypothetical protein [Polyangiaceae bacterium]